MGKVAALALTLFCGLMLLVLGRSAIALILGEANFGEGRLPMEYVSFGLIALFAGYGFYSGLRALLTRKASATPTDFKPIRRIGWALVIFGGAGVYTIAELAAAETPAFFMRFVLCGTACSLLGGGALVYFFRRRA